MADSCVRAGRVYLVRQRSPGNRSGARDDKGIAILRQGLEGKKLIGS